MMNFGDSVQIPGCSVKSRHLETSLGNSSLDGLLNGAIPVTSLVILDERESRAYADVLLRLFLAEGAGTHDLFLASYPAKESLLDNLPDRCTPSSSSPSGPASAPVSQEEMRIAWRYAPVKQVDSSIGKAESKFDLGKKMPSEMLAGSSQTIFPQPGQPFSYQQLLRTLKELLARPEYSKAAKSRTPRLLRVAIRGLGSPLWEDAECLPAFLARLPYLLRHAYVVVVAMMDGACLDDNAMRQAETASDAFFRLMPMSDEEKRTFGHVHGYFRIVRLPRLTALNPPAPPAVDLSYELHRKSFDVKVLHLPPAFGDAPVAPKPPCDISNQF